MTKPATAPSADVRFSQLMMASPQAFASQSLIRKATAGACDEDLNNAATFSTSMQAAGFDTQTSDYKTRLCWPVARSWRGIKTRHTSTTRNGCRQLLKRAPAHHCHLKHVAQLFAAEPKTARAECDATLAIHGLGLPRPVLATSKN